MMHMMTCVGSIVVVIQLQDNTNIRSRNVDIPVMRFDVGMSTFKWDNVCTLAPLRDIRMFTAPL